MKIQQGRKLRTKKIVGLSIIGFILLFSIISMVIVMLIYNGQFPRYDRHDTTVTVGLRYEDLEAQYPRSLVRFESGNNRLQGS